MVTLQSSTTLPSRHLHITRGQWLSSYQTTASSRRSDKLKAWQSTDIDTLCEDAKVKSAVLGELNKISAQCGMDKWERCAAVHLVSDEWTPANGMLTEAMKLKRHAVLKKYEKQVEQLYKSIK